MKKHADSNDEYETEREHLYPTATDFEAENWDALNQREPPEWHKRELDRTRARYLAGEERVIDWEDAKKELLRRVGLTCD